MEIGPLGGNVTGGPGSFGQVPAPKGKRMLCSLVDLVLVPVALGVVFGLLLLATGAPEIVNSVVLVVVNIAWMLCRDLLWSPGRKLFSLKLISQAAGGGPISFLQAILRNVLLIVPGVLLVGYPVEFVAILISGRRIMDHVAKTEIVLA